MREHRGVGRSRAGLGTLGTRQRAVAAPREPSTMVGRVDAVGDVLEGLTPNLARFVFVDWVCTSKAMS